MSESKWKTLPEGILTTGIGSLPHPYVDRAIRVGFQTSIPFLPQMPAKNKNEYMVIQAIDQLPGLSGDESGLPSLNLEKFKAETAKLREKTDVAFASGAPKLFEPFEPGPEGWSCWNPFLWELEERQTKVAKIQIAGPMTCQWAVQGADWGASFSSEVNLQIYRLVLARCLSMVHRLNEVGTLPILFIDEPGFYTFNPSDPLHIFRLQELKLFLQTLGKERCLLGTHCCSNTSWQSLLSLPIDFLSIDTQLSLESLLTEKEAVQGFVERGGRFVLGLVPTGQHSIKTQGYEPERLVSQLLASFSRMLGEGSTLGKQICQQAILSPACGLALHTVADADAILDYTLRSADILKNSL